MRLHFKKIKVVIYKMPKDKRKIYKAVKKNIDGHDYLVIKMKNLRPIDVRELRTEINIMTTDFFVQEEPEYVEKYDEEPEEPEYAKEVHFEKDQ